VCRNAESAGAVIVPVVHDDDLRFDEDQTDRNRWRLGLLTLLALLLIAGGILLFGGGSDPEAATTAVADPSISIPPLPAAARGEDAAPDFSLELFDGSYFSLASHLRDDGRPVILNLWASWCPPCRDEMPDLEAAFVDHPEVLILGVAVDDDPLAAEGFVSEIEITYPTGYDERGGVSRAYPTSGLPATFVISGDGALIATVFGRLTEDDIQGLVEQAVGG
jgi:thiol-disulfide isomerase/thioredoxin